MTTASAVHLLPARLYPPGQDPALLESLQAQRLRYKELFDAAPDGYVMTDRAGLILEANHAAAELLGTPRDLLSGKPLGFYLAPDHRRRYYQRLARPAPGVEHWEVVIEPPRGQPRAAELTLVADDQGYRCVLRDVTGARQAQRLAAIGQVAAGLAHEGRNALQRIQSCLSILEMRLAGQPEALDLVARAQKAQDDLTRLFEDVRTFGAPVRLELGPTNLAETWRQAWADLGPAAAAARRREDLDGADPWCHASPFHLRQVFRNLFDNAVAAGRGPAEVVVGCAADLLNGAAAVRVWVRDNGPGIPPEVRPHLFEPFHTTKARGTGLGLAICKRLVEAHGGRIEVADGPGPGAEVVIVLPRGGA